MPRYVVLGVLSLPVFTIVDAADEKQAKELADGRDTVGFCHQCGGDEKQALDEWCLQDKHGDVRIDDIEQDATAGVET